ncbi:MAG: caspase family protein, partial [Paracoccus sp. (in: a-proteobacteria)]|nr:caspase family protein [Paracoccus sp. (in: a-proteobacteria)]
RATSRGGDPAPVDLKHHVINMRFGEMSRDGQFQTSPSDVAAVADRAQAWIAAGSGRRLAIYAHGGLVSEGRALAQARATAGWWLENDVFPIFCIWESDALSVVLHMLRQTLGGRGRGPFDLAELRDSAVQRITHQFGTGIWATMKHSARLCSSPGDQHGLTLLTQELARAFGPTPPPLDLVGHSAGAVVLLHLLPVLRASGCSAHSFQTLAPAATTGLYLSGLQAAAPAMHCRIYTMTDQAERADNVAGIYGKSLLYLVSHGFEAHYGQAISGLQRDLLANARLVGGLTGWSAGVTREALVFAPPPPGTPQRLQSCATSHGDFDNDTATMWSVMRFIRGPGQDQRITPFPDLADGLRGTDAMLPDLPEDLRSYLALAETPAPPHPVQPQTSVVAAAAHQPARLALTIGIDHYAGASMLQGCVRDSDGWRDLLAQRGYQVSQYTRPEDTVRNALVAHLRDFVGRAGAGDSLIWHFSGHGMEILPESGLDDDFETTGRDQAIVASNTHEGLDAQLAHALIDDEIHTILQGLHPGAHLHAFLDSCYSGSATRLALPGRARSMGTLRRAHYLPHGRSLTAPVAGARGAYDGVNHVLYSAASATQKALENGAPAQGVFSRAVTDLLASRPGTMTNADFRTRINALTAGYEQTPGVYCDPARLAQPFPLA